MSLSNTLIIKKSSLVIMILSLLGAVICVMAGISGLKTLHLPVYGVEAAAFEVFIKRLIYAAVLVVAAFIFFMIFRNGRPFTRGNVWAVRGIAGLFLAAAVIPLFIEKQGIDIFRAALEGIGPVFISVLCLFFAEIMRYGRLLQNESDETL